MNRFKLAAAVFALAAAAWTAAQAGTVVVLDTWSYDQYTESGAAVAYLGEGRLRVEFKGKETNIQAIFSAETPDNPVMWIIDPAGETYTRMDKNAFKKMEGMMREQFEMFENYTANMSVEERSEFEKQYKKELRQAADMLKYEERMKKTSYKKIGDEKINEWNAVHLEGAMNKEKRTEVWISPWDEIGLDPADTRVLNQFSEAFGGFAGEMVPFRSEKIEGHEGTLEGFPVRILFFENGSKIIRQEVKEVRKEDLDPKLFEIPEGYTEKSPDMK